MPLNTPDITTAQIVGYLAAILSAAVILFKLDLTDAQVAAAIALIGALVPLGHFVADAIIRKGRSGAVAAVAIENAAVANAGSSTGLLLPAELGSTDDFPISVSTQPDLGDAASEPKP